MSAAVTPARESQPEGRQSGAFGQAPVTGPPPSPKQRLLDALRAVVRDPNPILLKELRATLRTPLFVRFLSIVAGLVATVVLMGSATVSEGTAAPAEVGRATYHIFFTVVWLVLLFTAPGQAASAFTLEKETKTWESLLLSGMSPTRIVTGKFIAILGSILLVVIAVAPVIGVSFLFGGVSPTAVLLAFYWLLGTLAVAVSFGIAVSIRVESTRTAVSLTSVLFIPLALMWAGMIVALGDAAQSSWSTPFDGPIWFGPALAERWGELDAWLLLVVLPTFFFSMLVWLNLAGAIAGVKAPGVDRSTGLKVWALYALFGTAVAVIGTTFLGTNAEDAGEIAVVFCGLALSFVFTVVALLFANEPPLPPRASTPAQPLVRFVWGLLGPGAAPTLRFTLLVLVVGTVGMCFGTAVPRHLRFPGSSDHVDADAAMLVLGVGGAAVLASFASIAAWLRSLLRNGAAARVLALVLFAGVAFGSMLVATVLDPRAVDRLDDELDPIIGLSPIGPLLGAIRFMDGSGPDEIELGTLALNALVYALLALAMWILVEVRGREVARLVQEHRQKLLAKLGPVPSRAALGPAVATAPAPETASTAETASAPETAPASAPETTSVPEPASASAPAAEPASAPAAPDDPSEPSP